MGNEEVMSNRTLCFWQCQSSAVGRSASSRGPNSDPQAVVFTLAIRLLVRYMGRVVGKGFGIVQVLWQEMCKLTQRCSGNLIWLLIGRWYYSIKNSPEGNKVWKFERGTEQELMDRICAYVVDPLDFLRYRRFLDWLNNNHIFRKESAKLESVKRRSESVT